MKGKFSHRIIFALVFSIFFFNIYSFSLNAQGIEAKRSGITWDLGFGSGCYNGLVLFESNSVAAMIPGRAKFTMLATAFRLVKATDLLNSRLSLGLDYGAQMVKEGGDNEYLIGVVNPDGIIHSILIAGDYLIGQISGKTPVYATGGLGMLLFAHIETRATDPFGPETNVGSTIQPAASLGIIVPVSLTSSFVFDPQIRFMGSAGKEKLLLAQFMLGLSYRW